MKRFIAMFALCAILLATFVSCVPEDIFSMDSDRESKSDTDRVTDTDDLEEETEFKIDLDDDLEYDPWYEETYELEPKYENALLMGFQTQASLYDGAFDSTVGWSAAGMGYIIRTRTGKFIVVDGGFKEDAERFYNVLKSYSDGEKVEIDYWIFTHSHGDHTGVFSGMATNELMDVTVKNLVYDFPLDFNDASGGCAARNREFSELAEAIGANIITPKKDDRIYLDGVEIHFLYTPVNYSSYTSTNAISLIFTVKTDQKSVMITGDAYEPSLKSVADEYKEALKCDVLQMPHHFLCDTGYLPFYEYVNAETVLLPSSIAGYNAMYTTYKGWTLQKVNDWAAQNATYVYKAFEGDFEIKM